MKSKNTSTIKVEHDGQVYAFREPLGRDLVALDDKLVDIDGQSAGKNISVLVHILAQLQEGVKLTADEWLDMPVALINKAGSQLMEFFRV